VGPGWARKRSLWARLREKGGRPHVIPCHHNPESYLTAYIASTGLVSGPERPLFRTIGAYAALVAGEEALQLGNPGSTEIQRMGSQFAPSEGSLG
jgi:hypothetical protein